MTDTNKNKHLNSILNEMYQYVNQREEDAKSLFKNLGAGIKERAIAKAVAKSSRDLFTIFYRKAELIGNVNKSIVEKTEALLEDSLNNYTEIKTILEASKVAKELEYKSPLELAIEGDFKLANSTGIKLPRGLREAFETLGKYGLLRKSIDINVLLSLPTDISLPRGNPLKGNMVRKLLQRGMTRDQANRIAEESINDGVTSVYGITERTIRNIQNDVPTLTPEQQAALAQVNKDRNEKSNADLLAMLGADDGTPQIDTTVDENDIDTSFDSNFSEEKEAS